ncbi:MAG TPA: M20/M25/M40 family metallo-hydrolase [Vicinamibacterales bacterium]|jgi:carboxypeptidase Q|nr:M20/M25/M40 family metallo-hydrolase [Vicinamibacterales bacterium]
MKAPIRFALVGLVFVALVVEAQPLVSGQAPGATDRETLTKIRTEGLEHSQVQPVFDMLTVNIGPRLTASPAQKHAAEWVRDRLTSYGLQNARLEPWQFGRGWTLEKLTVEMIEPRYMPLIGYADAWSPSTSGELVAAPLFVGGKTPEQIADMRAQLKGAIVMTQPMMANFVRKDRPQPTEESYVPGSAAYATSGGGRSGLTPAQRIAQVLTEAGAGVQLKPSIGEHGTVFVTGRDNPAGTVPSVTLSGEHYNMVARLLQQQIPVRLRVNVQSKYYDNDGGRAYNVLAELPGVDPALRDEVVMIGAHLDSWHTGVGATDNADGSTTVIEAVRILKAIGARPRRTIRVALWSGEEQGLLGSKAWVTQHLAGDANAAARQKFDVYLNIDNGTGPIYGWFLQNNEEARPLFDSWLEPLKPTGSRRNVIEGVGATDHLSFIDAGVPGFNPIQDYGNYDIRTHHTNMDTVDRVQVADIRQAAVAMATFAYDAAMADRRIPRAK